MKKTEKEQPSKEQPSKEKGAVKSPGDILKHHLSTNTNQFNTIVTDDVDYKVSMGSLKLDLATEGGLPCGILRMMGVSEGGKTSSALTVMRNFLRTVPNGRGLYIKAEGRLGPEVKKRCGVEFLDDEAGIDLWRSGDGKGKIGNTYVYKNNVYDDIINLIENLIEARDGNKYCIIIDSLDSLNLQQDLDKAKAAREGKKAENDKVAGAPYLTKLFFKRMSLPLTELGHMAILISQVSTDINIDKYSKGAQRKVSGTGGNAAMHFANWIFDYQMRFNSDLIRKFPDKKDFDADSNPIVGHWAKCVIRKSSNEKSDNLYRYPIKYGMEDGKSIWKAYEVSDQMFAFGLIEKRGAWINFSEHALEKMADAGIDAPFEKIQGHNSLRSALDDSEELCDFWYDYICDLMTGGSAPPEPKGGNDEIL